MTMPHEAAEDVFRHPAITDERGIVSLPPDPLPKVMANLALAAGLTLALARSRRT